MNSHTRSPRILALLLMALALSACAESAPRTPRAVIAHALADGELRAVLIERGAADDEFVHQVLERFSLAQGGAERLSGILAAHFEHHPATAAAVLRKLVSVAAIRTQIVKVLEAQPTDTR